MHLIGSITELFVRSPEPRYATFDFDGSIIFNDSAEATLAYMARQGYPGLKEAFEQYYSLLDSSDTRAAYRFGAGTLKNLSVKDLRQIVRNTMISEGRFIDKTKFLNRIINSGIRVRQEVAQLMKQLQDIGVDVYVVSASPQLVVEAAMEYFELKAKVIGVRNVIRDGIVTDELEEPLSIYEGKVACIQKLIHPEVRPLLAVGDSMNDFPMLEYAQLRAVIDRGEELATRAKESGWHIIPYGN